MFFSCNNLSVWRIGLEYTIHGGNFVLCINSKVNNWTQLINNFKYSVNVFVSQKISYYRRNFAMHIPEITQNNVALSVAAFVDKYLGGCNYITKTKRRLYKMFFRYLTSLTMFQLLHRIQASQFKFLKLNNWKLFMSFYLCQLILPTL